MAKVLEKAEPDFKWGEYYDAPISLEDHLGNVGHHSHYLAAILERRPQRLLEVGVGSGSMTAFFSHHIEHVLGVDLDERVLEKARATSARLRGRAKYARADAFSLARDLQDAGEPRFDIATSQGLLEHFNDDDIRRIVAQQLAVAPRVIASVPSFWYPRRDVGNERLMRPHEWATILQPLGRTVEITPYAYGRVAKNLGRWRPLQLMIDVA